MKIEFGFSSIVAIVLVLSLVLYILFKETIFAVLVFASLILLFLGDVMPKKKQDWKDAAAELVIALAVAFGAWLTLQFVLGTASPIDVVTSCSMLPNLERGDLVFLRGGEADATTVFYQEFPQISVRKELCTVKKGSEEIQKPCTTGVTINGVTYSLNKTDDVIVYEPNPQYYGLIIHRVFLKMKVGNQTYYLTKGDNNLALDQEQGISIVPQEKVHGKVILRVPYVGYLKLFLFLQFEEPPGCDIRVLAPK